MTTDLVVSGIQLPSTSSIADLAGNNANLSGAGADLGLQINTTSAGAAGPSGGSFRVAEAPSSNSSGLRPPTSLCAWRHRPPEPRCLVTIRRHRDQTCTRQLSRPGTSLSVAARRWAMRPIATIRAARLSATDGSHIADIALLGPVHGMELCHNKRWPRRYPRHRPAANPAADPKPVSCLIRLRPRQ